MLIRPMSENNVAPQKALNKVNDMYDLDIELSKTPASVGSLVNQHAVSQKCTQGSNVNSYCC